VDDRETTVFMGRPSVQVVAEAPRTGLVLAVAQVNREHRPATRWPCSPPRGHPGAAPGRCHLGPAAGHRPGGGAGRRSAETVSTVEATGQLGGLVPAGTVVLSTPPAGAAAADLAALQEGDLEAIAADPGSSAGLLGWLSDPG
jgi:hypothetical protein